MKSGLSLAAKGRLRQRVMTEAVQQLDQVSQRLRKQVIVKGHSIVARTSPSYVASHSKLNEESRKAGVQRGLVVGVLDKEVPDELLRYCRVYLKGADAEGGD